MDYNVLNHLYSAKFTKNSAMNNIFSKNLPVEELKKLSDKEYETFINTVQKDIESLAPKYSKEVYDNFSKGEIMTANKLKTILDKAQKLIKENGIEEFIPKPKIRTLSAEEKAQRKKLSEEYRKEYYDTVVRLDSLISIAKCLNRSGEQLSRQVMTFLYPTDLSDLGYFKKNIDMLCNKTPENYEARKNLFYNKMNEMFKLASDLTKPISDEDFIKKYKNKMPEIALIAEFQAGNIKLFENEFGVKLTEELKNKWKEMNSLLISEGTMINRFSIIASKNYCEIDEADIAHADYYISALKFDEYKKEIGYYFGNACKGNSTDYFERLEKINNAKEGIEDDLGGMDLDEYESKTFSNIFQSINSTGLIANPLGAAVRIEDFMKQEIKDEFNLKEKEYVFKDMEGREMTSYDAALRMTERKCVDIYDKNGKFLQSFNDKSISGPWGNVKIDKYVDLDLKNYNATDLRKKLEELDSKAEETTYWLMKSSQEYKDLRTTLKDLLKGNLEDKGFVTEKLKDISDIAHRYLLRKEGGIKDEKGNPVGAKVTWRTEPRLAFAKEIMCIAKNSLNAEIESPTLADENAKVEVVNEAKPEGSIVVNEGENLIKNEPVVTADKKLD